VADTSTVWRLGLIKIKYQLGKAGILPESYPELDKLAEYMKRHPSFVIQVGSHSDARWSDAFSDRLHTRRSQNCVDYLVAKGIERERLEARGYYDKDPVIPDSEINAMTDINKKEAAHQLNRRTEIRLIRTDFKPAN
jgi:peptidoglycan-associated lipoprotein